MPRNAKAIFFCCILIVVQLAAGAVLAMVPGFSDTSYFGQMLLTYLIMYPLPVFLFFKISKWDIKDTLPMKPLRPVNLITVLLITLVSQPLMNFLSALGALFSENLVADVLLTYQDMPLWQLWIIFAVCPAVFEEIVFRGIVFSGYRNIPEKAAIVISGIVFGMMHLNLQQLLYAAALGMLFSYFVRRTGSLLSTILAHLLINGSQVTLAKVMIEQTAAQGMEYSAAYASAADATTTLLTTGVLMLFSLPVLFILLRAFNRLNPAPKPKRHTLLVEETALDYAPLPGTEEKILHWPFYLFFILFTVIATTVV